MATIMVNIGERKTEMPLKDYLEIQAMENGFSDYEEVITTGMCIEFSLNKVYLREFKNNTSSRTLEEYGEKLEKLGWKYNIPSGGYISPDDKLIFYTDRQPYQGMIKELQNEKDLRNFLYFNELSRDFVIC